MTLVDRVIKGDLKNVKKILNEKKVSNAVLMKAINIAAKRRSENDVLNVLDTNKKDKSNYTQIHNLLIAHNTVKKAKANTKNIDTHIVSKIAEFMGGRKRRTRKRARTVRRHTRRVSKHRNRTRRRHVR